MLKLHVSITYNKTRCILNFMVKSIKMKKIKLNRYHLIDEDTSIFNLIIDPLFIFNFLSSNFAGNVSRK